MATTQATPRMEPSTQDILPGIDEMIKTQQQETYDSSASTIPPTFMQNSEAKNDTQLEPPPLGLLSSLPTIRVDPPSHNNASTQAAPSSQPHAGNEHQQNSNIPKNGNGNASNAVEALPYRRVQKRKRGATQQPKKTKQPRLAARQAILKKRGRPKGRKNRNAKGKQGSAGTNAPVGIILVPNNENAIVVGKNVGTCVNNASQSREGLDDVVMSQVKDTEFENSEKIPGQQGSSMPSTGILKQSSEQSSKKACIQEREGSKPCEAVGTLVQQNSMQNHKQACRKEPDVPKPCGEVETLGRAEERPTFSELGDKPEEMCNAVAMTDPGVDEGVSDDNGGTASEEPKDNDKTMSDDKDGLTLEEKYEDLWKRYTGLITGMMKIKPRSKENSDTECEEDNGRKSPVIDHKVYDTIYLCKVAGMLGALNIGGEASRYLRPGIDSVDNPYERVVMDGFEFVEHLMIMGEPEESLKNVKRVFRDLHIRLLMDLWERYHIDVGAGKALVGMILKTMVEQVKVWYMMIMDSQIGVRWCAVISEEFVEVLLGNLSNMDESMVNQLICSLREVLLTICEFYREAEKDVSKASIDRFCNSCEVGVCIARAVPDAVLGMDEEDAFTIGRHNSVFAHCVARLQAERDAEEAVET